MSDASNIALRSFKRFSPELESGVNPFLTRWGRSSDQEWLQVLLRSISEGDVDGCEFPAMPDPSLQSRIQGTSNELSYRGAAAFYSKVKSETFSQLPAYDDRWYLDFGSGWGRTLRPFMRDFTLSQVLGYEPNAWFCQVARSLNPYVSLINGPFLPDRILPEARFSLITSYSVFSHLPRHYAISWLAEFARVLNDGGFVAFTTWGSRFLDRLKIDQNEMIAGNEIHFYSKVVIDAVPDLDAALNQFSNGEYLFFGESDAATYGETFLSRQALEQLIDEEKLPFRVHTCDTSTLAQDLFILQKVVV